MTNREILIKANAAVSAGDNEGFLIHCTDDMVWEFVGDQTITGKQAIREYMVKTYVEPPQFDVSRFVCEDDVVSAIGKISLADANGKSIGYDYCDIWTFRDGKMAHLTAFVIAEK